MSEVRPVTGLITAIDPGPKESAFLRYAAISKHIVDFAIVDNSLLLAALISGGRREVAIEMVASYGMAVGRDIFETVYWIGRFSQAAESAGCVVRRVYRADIKLHLCNARNAKDTNVRQALMDRYGGSKEVAVGTKKAPGPLYGVSRHVWSALAVAITDAERAKGQ